MSAPTYLVAKYVPDMARMEPRNFGVVLWASGGVAYRFMPSDDVASIIDDTTLYQRWVNFWSESCAKTELLMRNGEKVSRRSERFLNALMETQKGGFLLYEGGFIPENVPAADRDNAADFLYRKLVLSPNDQAEEPETLAKKCNTLLADSGVAARADFVSGYSIELEAEGVIIPYRFDYAIAGEEPAALMLRVNTRDQKSTTNAAFLWEHAKSSARTKKSARLALVDGAQQNEAAASRAKMLANICDVIDIADSKLAELSLRKLRL